MEVEGVVMDGVLFHLVQASLTPHEVLPLTNPLLAFLQLQFCAKQLICILVAVVEFKVVSCTILLLFLIVDRKSWNAILLYVRDHQNGVRHAVEHVLKRFQR